MKNESSVLQLRAWKSSVQREIDDISAKIQPLQTQLDAAKERLDLITRLLHLSEPEIGIDPFLITNGSPATRVENEIEQILRQVGRPLHIREIRERLVASAVPLPGKGSEANIILRLRRAQDRFTRTARGMYGLSEWDASEAPEPVRPKRRRKRKRSRSRRTPVRTEVQPS